MTFPKRLFTHIYVTPNCNLKCKHCYYVSKPANHIIDYPLSFSDIAKIITCLSDEYDACFDVEGGELFLRDGISTLFEMLPKDYLRRVTITTNGIAKINLPLNVIMNLDEFRISVEGHTDILQKEIRGIGLAPVMRTCADLKSSDIPFVLRITLHKKNYQNIVEMLRYFSNQGFNRFSLYEFQSTGRGERCAQEYELNESEIAHVFKILLTNSSEKDFKLLKISLSIRRISTVLFFRDELEKQDYEIIDLSGASSLTVNYDGALGVCPWKVHGERIGYYNSQNFISDMKSFIGNKVLNHYCNHCSAIRVQKIYN